MDRFEGEAMWGGTPVRIQLSIEDGAELDDGLAVAESLWADEPAWRNRIKQFAVSELLPLKNENWLDEDESPLTDEQFLERMTLTSIDVSADGGFRFWHDDGDLFFGHAIEITGTIQDGPTRADIPG